MQRKTHSKKASAVKDLEALFQKYPIFSIADLKGLKASQLQVLKKKFKGDLEIHVAKNRLVKRAIENLAKKYVKADEIKKYLSGPNAFVFSNKNPFSLYLMFEKNKVESAASPGDIAPNDIVISAGNTGLQPGPILSKFGAAKIPTKIQDGSVWIAKDMIAVKKGDAISADMADLLGKLGLKPIMVGLKLRMAYDSGVIPGDVLCINLDEYKANMKVAVQYAVNLSVNAVYTTKETAPLLIAKAYAQARSLAVKSGMPVPEVIGEVLSMAEQHGKVLAETISKKHPELKL
jgi:large subunit ribosomal protein L10